MKDKFYSNIDDYFNRKAKFYSRDSKSLFWSMLRNAELKGFKKLINNFERKFFGIRFRIWIHSNFLYLMVLKKSTQ